MLYNILSIYFFGMVLIEIYLAAYIRSQNGAAYTRKMVLLSFAVCFYMFGYSMELNSTTKEQIMFWNGVEYIGIPFVSALWFSIGLMYTGYYYPIKKRLLAAIYFIPLVSFVLRITNEYHHLYFAKVSFISESGKLFLQKEEGPWMYVQLIHSMSMILITLGLFIYDFMKSRKKGTETGKISLMIAASSFAVAGLVFLLAKPFGLYLDYMVLCLPLTCILVNLAILRYDFLETKTLARNKVFEASSDAILLINHQNKVIDYNKSAKKLFEQINVPISEGYITTLFKSNPQLLKGLSSTEVAMASLEMDGEERFFEIHTREIGNNTDAPQGWIKSIRDVTKTHKLNETLKRQAMVDVLSGLINRRAFMQFGQELVKDSEIAGKTMHLLMMDLDHFKNVNDQYGHQAGDKVIHNFGKVLKDNFEEGTLIARLGGEEFAVLLSGLSDLEIEQKADQLLKTVALFQHNYQGKKFHVTVSMGIAKKGQPRETLDNLVHQADKALYKSKSRGRNCVTGWEGIN
jgi:diguanylate cyclase (GGDEF)-like protein